VLNKNAIAKCKILLHPMVTGQMVYFGFLRSISDLPIGKKQGDPFSYGTSIF